MALIRKELLVLLLLGLTALLAFFTPHANGQHDGGHVGTTEDDDEPIPTFPLTPSLVPVPEDLFANELDNPLLNVAQFSVVQGKRKYVMGMYETNVDMGLRNHTSGETLLTRVWAYGQSQATASVPGPTFIVKQNRPVTVRWENNLKNLTSGRPLRHFLPVDTTIHFARPPDWPRSGVPTVVHLHGGRTEPHSDGHMAAWFTPNGGPRGTEYRKATYNYENEQEAMTLWYHDHAMGLTRIHVYSGLAGFYLIDDEFHWTDPLLGRLPSLGPFDVPLMITDRSFNDDGSLFYPPNRAGTTLIPSIPANFNGQFMLVNGKIWPYIDVQARLYRFRVLNACNFRTLTLDLTIHNGINSTGTPLPFWVIASDQGLLSSAVNVSSLTIGPSERYEIVIDFALYRGKNLILRNTGGNTEFLRQVMQFRVSNRWVPFNPDVPVQLRREPIDRTIPPNLTVRQVTLLLNTGEPDAYGRKKHSVGNPTYGHIFHSDMLVTEFPEEGKWEIWEIWNTGGVAHPFHIHLIRMIVLDHTPCSCVVDPISGVVLNHTIGATQTPLQPYEMGWKDVIRVPGNTITRVLMYWTRPGIYMMHCHLLEHEDFEMMRDFIVVSA